MDRTIRPQKGSAFKPRDNEKMIASGFINQSDSEVGQYDGDKVIITRTEVNGKSFHDIFVQAGRLYQSDNKEYKLDGDFLGKKIFIFFNKSQSGIDYMGLSLAGDIENNKNQEQLSSDEEEVVDEIPF
jgi:hypothetical protein